MTLDLSSPVMIEIDKAIRLRLPKGHAVQDPVARLATEIIILLGNAGGLLFFRFRNSSISEVLNMKSQQEEGFCLTWRAHASFTRDEE